MTHSMSRIWAPWRLAYIRDKKKKGCPFCALPKGKNSEANLVLWKDPDCFVIMNKFPYNPAHLLVIPRAHVSNPDELDPAVWRRVADAQRACLTILQEAYQPQGFNVGINLGAAAGAGIPSHLHWHIVPRWSGDTNFLPLIGETKALPVHNETVYRRLKPFFADFEKRMAAARIKKR